MKSQAWRDGLIAGLWHGAVMVLAFAPVGWSALMLAAPLGAGWIARRPASRPWVVAVFAAIGMFPAWLFLQQWVVPVSIVGYVPMCAYLAAYEGLFVLLLLRIRRWGAPLSVALPAAWIGVEFLRGEIAFTGYAMLLTAHPLMDAGPLGWSTRLAPHLGAYGVGLISVGLVGGILDVFSGRRRCGLGALGVFGIATGVGWFASSPAPSGASVRVAVVQTNVLQDNKLRWSPDQQLADWRSMAALVQQAAASEPDVIVLPETMFPGLSLTAETVATERREGLTYALSTGERMASTLFHDELRALSTSIRAPILVGAIALEGFWIERSQAGLEFHWDEQYNSVFLVQEGDVDTLRYDKMRLTPFGEVMPYISAWPWLERQLLALGAGGMTFDLGAGEVAHRFEIGEGVVAATPICFEATSSAHCRRLVSGTPRAGVMINVTNDGWFGGFDAGRRHHELAARWRSLELRTPMVRAANTGVSSVIGADGRIKVVDGRQLRLEPRKEGVLLADVVLADGPVPSGMPGRILVWVCVASLLAGVIPSRQGRTSDRPSSKEATGGD